MKLNDKVIKIRKLQKIKVYFNDLIAEEKDQIAEAKLNYKFNLYCNPTLLMKKIYALCYRHTFRTCKKTIDYWQKRYLQNKKRILDN